MIRASDFTPLAALAIAPLSPLQDGRGAQTLNPSSWFDGDGFSADARIGVELDRACRGLSVAQHAERVLAQLFGEFDESGR
jgi:hypothetical protein